MVSLRLLSSQERVRSAAHLCRPNFWLLSTPLRAIRHVIPRVPRAFRHLGMSYALSPCHLSGRLRGRPGLPCGRRIGSMLSTISSKTRESWVLAPVSFTERGMPHRSTTRWRFVPGLPLSVGFGPTACACGSPFLLPSLARCPSRGRRVTNLSCPLLPVGRVVPSATCATHLAVANHAVFANR